jgi:hypothetical protein
MFELLSSSGVVAAALIAPPGPEVCAALLTVHPGSLQPAEEVDVLIAWERQTAWLASITATVMARVGDLAEAAAEDFMTRRDSADMALRAAYAEIGAALRLSDVTAGRRLETARVLVRRLPAVHAALAAGDITYWHAFAVADATSPLDEPKAAAVAARVLGRARHQTVAQLRRCLRRAVIAADPAAAAERAAFAKAKRCVDWRPLDDGMAELRISASAVDIMRLFNTTDTLARTMPHIGTDGAFLPIAARRVDAFIDLVTTDHTDGKSRGRKPAVSAQVTIDLLTLLGLQNNPGELTGYGPIPPDVARALAAAATTWRRLIHDPLTGALLDLGVNTYKPTEALSRYIGTRDPRCTFPGCYQPAWRCEIDHIIPHRPGCCGPTDRHNLGPLCKSHHRLKTEAGWRKRRDPDTGQTIWTSLLGHHYFIEPVDFRANPDIDWMNGPDNPPLPESIQQKLDAENLSYCQPTAPQTAEECPF